MPFHLAQYESQERDHSSYHAAYHETPFVSFCFAYSKERSASFDYDTSRRLLSHPSIVILIFVQNAIYEGKQLILLVKGFPIHYCI